MKNIFLFSSFFTLSLFSMDPVMQHRFWRKKGFNYKERCKFIADEYKASAEVAKKREKEQKLEQAKRDLKKGLKFLAAKVVRDHYLFKGDKLQNDLQKLGITNEGWDNFCTQNRMGLAYILSDDEDESLDVKSE